MPVRPKRTSVGRGRAAAAVLPLAAHYGRWALAEKLECLLLG